MTQRRGLHQITGPTTGTGAGAGTGKNAGVNSPKTTRIVKINAVDQKQQRSETKQHVAKFKKLKD